MKLSIKIAQKRCDVLSTKKAQKKILSLMLESGLIETSYMYVDHLNVQYTVGPGRTVAPQGRLIWATVVHTKKAVSAQSVRVGCGRHPSRLHSRGRNQYWQCHSLQTLRIILHLRNTHTKNGT